MPECIDLSMVNECEAHSYDVSKQKKIMRIICHVYSARKYA